MNPEVKAPLPGTLWLHRTGRRYRVILIANEGSDRERFPPMVVYRLEGTRHVYSRRVSEWTMTPL